MKKQAIISLLLCGALTLCGCGEAAQKTAAPAATGETAAVFTAVSEEAKETAEITVFSDRDMDSSYSLKDSVSIALNGKEIVCDSSTVEVSGTTATIREAGTYLLSGVLEDGSIIVDGSETDKIQLVLNGVSVHSTSFAPVYVRQADKVFVTLAEGTENTLSGGGSFEADGEVNVDAVIFSREDLTLNGSGSLTITSPGGHGIVSKDSLRVTGGTYTIDAASHSLSGKDEVSIAGGSFELTAGKDGIHAENSEDTDKGTVCITGGDYRITADGDGISASGSCRILDGTFSITAGGGSENASQHTSGFPGDRMNKSRPADGAFEATRQGGSSRSFPDGQSGKKGGSPEGDSGIGQMQPPQGNMNTLSTAAAAEETDSVSAKGIKAADLAIDGGTFYVDSADDGIHSNGDLTVQGGTLEIASGDDGLHADGTVTILAGSITITESYEGIEGQHVCISGGNIALTASDDGLNAAGGVDGSGFGRRTDTFSQSADTPSIVISGGTVRIMASGDGIDANGSLEITGGDVTVCGPIQGDTSVLDYDLSGVITGGTFIGTGASAMAQTFSGSSQGVISVNAGTQRAGTEITLTGSDGRLLLSCTPEQDFQVVILSSPDIRQGESCTLTIGEQSETFTAQ
ncbi:MAG: carbohydrate-binding domain-containing protein [Faecousia sp.]